MLKIIDKITKEHVFENLESKDKESLFRALSEKIAPVASASADAIFDAFKKREDEYTTNIGNGVAVPHGRIQNYGKTDIFVGFLKDEINYDSDSDEKSPVKLVFAILSDLDNPQDYLLNLSQIFFLVNQKEILDKVMATKSYDELSSVLESFKKLDEKFEAEKQIKFLIELERAEIQIKAYELYSSTHSQQKSDVVLEEYKKYKDTILSKIDVAVLENYKRIKENKGEALAKIENYKCSACNVAIPKMTVNEVRRQNQIIMCFHCGRILFTTD
ncbi:PTS sugar transporter subunit IIA [Brachyspira alvinipulli]|uniref:PTS sugar transporter subunit IIA n=1 Tax=Brachyspira alvinipulli TaxID=84379 RepID=UPI000482F447|nr:PTS sugar transporter subunit IIA [Brachyspira alvinipulli]